MVIGERLREIREQKKMSQGDVENKTGLLRCYISRVENGYTVPSVPTLEKLARAFEVPMYRLFYDGENPPKVPNMSGPKSVDEDAWGKSGRGAEYVNKLRRLLAKASENDRKLILFTAQKMARE
jgi:transcriptional regulator with XRE-family HTH domain